MKLPAIVLFVIVFAVDFSLGQEFAIKKIELSPDGMILHYDLVDTSRSEKYTINVYTSADNFQAPVRHVTGDAGLQVEAGFDRKITWNSRKELGETFHGEVTVEIRGKVYQPFIKFDSFQEGRVIKRA